MVAIITDCVIEDDRRRSGLFQGDVFVHRPLAPAIELCGIAKEYVEKGFHPHDAQRAQYELPVERYAEILAEIKPRFIHDSRCKRLIAEIVKAVGGDVERTYFDVPRLRSSTSDNYLTTGIAYAFHPHRDTWYSAPPCQINWWLPVYPIDSGSGMAIHPQYFSDAVENTSERYDYYRWNKESRANAAAHIKTDTREQPKAVKEMRLDPDLRIVTAPGGIFQFSAGHLHSSLPNQTGKTRFSIDFRTVHIDDVAAKRGAPNIDSRCTGTTLRDFLRCSDLSPLPEELISAYDDRPPPADAVLTFEHRRMGRAPSPEGD